MALCSDAAMVLFYDIEGDPADHDDWHSREHFHERLAIPGFLRATRWVAFDASPRYFVTYEVSNVGVATSQAYLDRLNNPTPWTSAMMPRFRGMVRGFCHVIAGAGLGFGGTALAMRFLPETGHAESLSEWLAVDVIAVLASWQGMVGAHLLRPAPPPPMTREQSLRGPDAPMPWLLVATACDTAAIGEAASYLDRDALRRKGATEITLGSYALHHTAAAIEAAQCATPPAVSTSE